VIESKNDVDIKTKISSKLAPRAVLVKGKDKRTVSLRLTEDGVEVSA
jgi:hypothetical protein